MSPKISPVLERDTESQSGRSTIAGLRAKSATRRFSFLPIISAFLGSMSHFRLMMKGTRLHNKMCENYGHNVDGQKWERGRLHCRDCGIAVTDTAQLRKSLPK